MPSISAVQKFLHNPWFFRACGLVILSIMLIGLYSFTGRLISVVIFAIGMGLGASLNYFHFGFSRSFRLLFIERETLAMRAIIWMLGIAIALFAVLQATTLSWQGESLHGFVRPFGLANVLGAILFGVGMQLGIGCTSGTLNRAGQLQFLSLPTLLAMMVGGTATVAYIDIWREWPSFSPWSFYQAFSFPIAVGLQLVILGLLYRGLLAFEARGQTSQSQTPQPLLSGSKTIGLHPWLLAAIGLASLNALLFWVSGAPWSISAMFPYWGILALDGLGSDVFDWPFWSYVQENQNHLNASMFENTISLTTLGLVSGALMITLFFRQVQVATTQKPLQATLVSVLAGLLMGVGAILASGCNIGAFFSGIASGSLHGWLWLPFALLGNAIGLWLKARYALLTA